MYRLEPSPYSHNTRYPHRTSGSGCDRTGSMSIERVRSSVLLSILVNCAYVRRFVFDVIFCKV